MRNEIVFRIVGQNILPSDITRELNIKPDESFKRGAKSKLRPERIHPNGLWLLKSNIAENECIEKHIENLLNKLKNKEQIVKKYSKCDGIYVEIFCGIFIDDEDEIWDGIKVKSDLLIEIGSIGIDLNIQVYNDID